jgi:aminomethyltransferase
MRNLDKLVKHPGERCQAMLSLDTPLAQNSYISYISSKIYHLRSNSGKMALKRTALTPIHERLGAKMVDFGGFLMPVQYTSIRAEHRRVRTTVGVFDVSHMGEFVIRGPDRKAFVNWTTVNNVEKLETYQVQYSCACYPDGGIVDDLLVYRFSNHLMMIVNAANIDKDWAWFVANKRGDCKLENISDSYSLLAVQGRHAEAVVQKLTTTDLSAIKYYWCSEGEVAGAKALISRTGYTGEDGFELMVANKDAPALWDALFDAGKEFEIEPIGLGARDSLRLEMKFCLYGNDIDQTTNPLEAGLGWITKLKKGDFIGREPLLKVKEEGPKRKLIGFEIDGVGFPRPHYRILSGGQEVGQVTSGTVSPMSDKGIGLGYVPVELSEIDTKLEIDARGRILPARVVKTPFYQRPY